MAGLPRDRNVVSGVQDVISEQDEVPPGVPWLQNDFSDPLHLPRPR
eukprot:CAMPEP_0196726116 /NCGR_PEP_ID=MMETSP1091-20130531/7471_1 /TAXON_ID=302021 /ORGANISM="Rhodomonas sp., Strain CCMP768" /LENGTH=45 /DNA_ID= /DNA_START= /DNA_END= /DNA_ORIENTATION=